jgi:hypothetical protein
MAVQLTLVGKIVDVKDQGMALMLTLSDGSPETIGVELFLETDDAVRSLAA